MDWIQALHMNTVTLWQKVCLLSTLLARNLHSKVIQNRLRRKLGHTLNKIEKKVYFIALKRKYLANDSMQCLKSHVIVLKTVCNHVKLGVSLRVPYCVVDAGYGLGRSLGDCRPALPKGRKYQLVKTQTVPH